MTYQPPSRGWKQRLARLDWQFIRGSSMTTLGIAVARVLGFAFSFLVARAFTTADAGLVQYTITLATLVAICTIPFAEQVMPWFISRYREHKDPTRLPAVMSSGWLILAAIFVGTLVVSVPILAVAGRLHVTVLVIFSGLTLFNVYAGVSRGFLDPGRLLAAFLGSNLLQLIAVIVALQIWGAATTMPVLLIYGLSYVIPIAVLQYAAPLPLHFRRQNVRRADVRDMLRFAAPLWGSHTLFTISFALDILLLERFHGESAVGVYALTKTIVLGFSFVPQGITMILMPRVAATRDGDHRAMLKSALVATVLANAAALVVYLLAYRWFVETLVGPAYFIGYRFAVLMAVSAVVYSVHAILTSYLIGRKRPELETVSRAMIAAVLVIAGFTLIPSLGIIGAAWTSVAGSVAGVLSYTIILVARRNVPPIVTPE